VTQDIGQTVREAVEQAKGEAAQALREAQQELRNAQREVRDAQQEVRNAQQEVRHARTADQRSEANDDLRDAQEQLRDAENELRQAQGQARYTPMVGVPSDLSRSGIPAGAMDIAIGFCITLVVIIVGWPISRALGRRIERRGASQAVEPAVTERLQRIEQAVEAVAIEVERISESQRYLAKIQAR
jgi:DNA repair exonuclease SbcCD ATPase subunit